MVLQGSQIFVGIQLCEFKVFFPASYTAINIQVSTSGMRIH